MTALSKLHIVRYYSKNPCLWEIGTILNEAGEGVIHHLLSHDLNMVIHSEIHLFVHNIDDKITRMGPNRHGLISWQHLHAHTHYSSRRQTRTDPGNTSAHTSAWVISKLYYVLPMLHPCHLCTIIEANSKNMWLNRTNNTRGAKCLLLDPKFPNMVVTWWDHAS